MATKNASGTYQCGICNAGYARPDHLIRHVRGHTKHRPFICSMCAKGFGRQDLLKRHLATHDGQDGLNENEHMELPIVVGSHTHRVQQACRSCAAKKLKCTEQKPCQRCKDRNMQCDYDQASEPMERQRAPAPVPDLLSQDQLSLTSTRESNEPNIVEIQSEMIFQSNDHSAFVDGPSMSPSPPNNAMPPPDTSAQDILNGTLNIPDIGDFIEFEPDSIMEDIDFSFLNYMDTPAPPLPPAPPPPDPAQHILPLSPTSDPTPSSSTVGVGTEAYHKSQALNSWEPGRGDGNEAEHQNLILTQNVRPEGPLPASAIWATSKKNLSLAMRDRILAMILRMTSRTASDRIMGSFPSLDVLESLIHLAFVHMRDQQVIQFVHLPSLDLNEQRPELLGAFIAYGSVCSPSPAVRKFGYAVQEAVRTAILRLVEEDHTALRELGTTQAFYIQLYLGYFSGINRKIEMAESSSMLGVTVLRRGKRLRAEQYHPPEAILRLPGLSLQSKWLRWVEEESFKRLVYFAVTLDANVSLSRKINVLFHYSEIETPLPTASRLWNADTTAKWFEILREDTELSGTLPPPLCMVVRGLNLFTVNKAIADTSAAAVIFFAGFWALVQEYRQMDALFPDIQSWNDFVINSRYSDLISILERSKLELVDFDNLSPKALIIQELVSLHLNVSFYTLTNYAGRGNEEDAQSAVPYVQRWFQSPQSRLAIWHAGQVFRLTKLLEPGSLTDIYAIALYHAAVTLWIWSLVHKTQTADLFNTAGSRVVVDEEESGDVLRFFRGSRGLPGLTGESGRFVPLSVPAQIADLAKDIVLANWRAEPLPLTTEEVVRLMEGFSKVSRQRFD